VRLKQCGRPTSGWVDHGLGSGNPSVRKNVTAWRAHNDRRWRFEKDGMPPDERIPFVCECTSGECFMVVSLTVSEYEAAHMCANWTAALPGHVVDDDATRVLTKHPHFWIIELDSGGRDPLSICR
jgi:hypothetical protein